MAEWLELVTLVNVTLVHREREVAGSNPGSDWVATGGFWVSFRLWFIPRFLTCWSIDPNSPVTRDTAFLAAFGAIHVK